LNFGKDFFSFNLLELEIAKNLGLSSAGIEVEFYFFFQIVDLLQVNFFGIDSW